MFMIEVVSAEYIKEYKIKVDFNNGQTGIVDLKKNLWGEAFEPLKDINLFKNFKVNIDTIEWSNGVDIAPEFLYDIATGVTK